MLAEDFDLPESGGRGCKVVGLASGRAAIASANEVP